MADDTAKAGIETDFSRKMSYGDYLGLDALLAAQRPLSGQHDEMLFIVITRCRNCG
jgi:tryptophan 2,3-dioxygenase